MANSCLRCADQIAGANMVMLRCTPLLVFVHKLRFCTFREVCHKSHVWSGLHGARGYSCHEGNGKFQQLPSCDHPNLLHWEGIPRMKDILIKKGWGRSVTKIRTATKGDQSSTTAYWPMIRVITFNGYNNFKTFAVSCYGNWHRTNRNRCCTP